MRMFTKEEIKELFAETDKRIDRLGERIDRLAEKQEKTDAQIAETNKGISELKERQEKTDAQLAKTDALIDKVAAKMDKMNDMYGGLSNNVGSATEEYFYNALKKKRTLNGIRFDDVQRNWGRQGGTQNDEFDIVMLTPKASPGDGTAISIIEVKLKAHEDHINKILNTQKKRFNEIFPEYKDYEQHWALATFSIDDKLIKKAQASGLTVLRREGGIIEHNPPTRPEEIQLIGA